VVACPNKCITLQLNEEGFFTPVIDEQHCVNCGLCADVCYKLFDISAHSEGKQLEDCKVYSAIHRDTKELKSVTSGGIASELSKYCFENGYDVLGVVMNPENDYCEHIIASCEDDLERMKKSKYVQSYTLKAFKEIQPTHKTLIIGCPCQIYGIRKYIKQMGAEDNFILVDLFCRGVPTTNLYRKYREYLQLKFGLGKLVTCDFRSKRMGWHKFSITARDEEGNEYSSTVYEDMFFSFYLKNTCFKESCYNCELRHGRVFADIRLGDFWGAKYYSHDEGVSIVSIYTQKGRDVWNKISDTFISEENEPPELKKSQPFNKLPIPSYRTGLLAALKTDEPLESIHARFGINKMGFYKEENKKEDTKLISKVRGLLSKSNP
jgi:coenzyme F420-reducing hydrogenase beta subunit